MTQSNEDRIEEIFHAALALSESERSAFVGRECGGDPACIQEVISLLEAVVGSGFLHAPVVALGATDSLPGTVIEGRYELERELVPGGMAKVYLARDLQLPGKFVVIKILPDASMGNPDAVRRFKREVEALTLIEHPGVVSVLGAGQIEGKPYIVMQYIEGPTLRSEIQGGGIEPKRAAALIKQIGAAVGHIHDKGILHRDLKPENIMLQLLSDGTEVVKIVDFGIATIKDSINATGAINTVPIGTLAYMSPEQLRGGETITASSDIYSMAVVACEMITGKRPEPASQGRWRPKPVEVSMVRSAEARSVISKGLESASTNRPQSAKLFGEELAAALLKDGGKTNVRRPVPKKSLVAAAGVLVIGLLCYGIYKYLNRPPVARPRSLTSTTTQSKGFNYWLTVQRTRDGKDYGTPYKSNGNDMFDSGDKFRLNVMSLESGYLYIFNEGPIETNSTSFRMLYPNKGMNDASASVGANQTIQTEWITFRGPGGTDNYWIVWSASPVSELEYAKDDALKHPQAGLTDQNLVKIKEYLKTMDAEVNARAARFIASQDVQVRKRSDLVLTFAEFKYR